MIIGHAAQDVPGRHCFVSKIKIYINKIIKYPTEKNFLIFSFILSYSTKKPPDWQFILLLPSQI